MPINNDLPDKKFPMQMYHGDKATTGFISHLNAIDVKILSAPSMHHLQSYIPKFALATWEARPTEYTTAEELQAMKDLFDMKLLPGAMETINLVFQISNIDLVDVTHLIRHRTMTFSAHCTGDRDQRHDACLVKPSIENSSFMARYTRIVEDAKQLYADMVDSPENISILDARTVLPRSMENHYYAKCNLKDLIHYLHQRLDRQIQPESDNILAMKILIETCKMYPLLKKTFDLDAPDNWYVKTAQTDHSSNLYMPEKPRNDVFDHKEQWFVHNRQRSEMCGGFVFKTLWDKLREEYDAI